MPGAGIKSGFILLYSALNQVEAHMVKFLLENNGVEAIIDNDKLNFFFGIVSAKDAMVEVWVPAHKYREAAHLLAEKSSLDLSALKMTNCPRCGEKVCVLFDYCWNCLTNLKTGKETLFEDVTTGASYSALKGRHLSIYLLILLIVSIMALYLVYFYFRFP